MCKWEMDSREFMDTLAIQKFVSVYSYFTRAERIFNQYILYILLPSCEYQHGEEFYNLVSSRSLK